MGIISMGRQKQMDNLNLILIIFAWLKGHEH